MTTPATNTPQRVIKYAMINAGLLADGTDPSSDNYANYMIRLNDLINFWQTQGLKLWLQTDLSITLVAGTALYSLYPSGTVAMTKPLRVVQGYFQDSAGTRRPLIPISREEYSRLSTVTQQGPITQYFVDKQYDRLNVSFWLVPDSTAATGTGHLIIQSQATNLVSLTDTIQFPQEWFIALCWGLADEICTGQPQAIMDRCQQRAMTYRDALENWDVEDAPTRFEPNLISTGYSAQGFK